MELKKSPKANLENKKGLFLEIGLIVSIALVIGAFAMTQKDRVVEVEPVVFEAVEEEIVELVREDDTRPLVAAHQTVIVASEIINLVNNDRAIAEDLVFEDFSEETAMVTSIMQGRTEGAASDEPYYAVEVMPGFQGGNVNTFRRWVQERLSDYASRSKAKGQVVVKFAVERDGSLGRFDILTSTTPEMGQEVVAVLKKSPKWTPGKQGGVAVPVWYSLPIDFEVSNGW